MAQAQGIDVNDIQQQIPNLSDIDDEKTTAIGHDEAILAVGDKTEAMERMRIEAEELPLPPKLQTEVPMETDKTRLQRGLDELEGEVISGRYKIIKRIGKGGMGVVYLAQQTNLNRNVCIKVLNPALLDDEDAVSRFEREAKGLSRLQHPNIVTIFDYGRDGNLAYIVMEYAQGETLGKYLKAHGALSGDEFLPIAVQTLKGIGEAHKMGLIHRDIKPANIVLCELEGEKNFVKILDFGLAKLAQGGEDLTKDQQLVGSASYMAPEQILVGTSDTRTDVYALGVMFYLMLSGKKPFTGSNDNAILYQHVNATAAPLKSLINPSQNVPDTLCDVVEQCLQKAPEKRPQTALDLLNAISFALDAPQLRAGYSSMTLQHVDLQKISEEAETHFIEHSSVHGLAPVSSAGQVVDAPHSEVSGALPPMMLNQTSGVSGVVSNSGISVPLVDNTNTFARSSQEAHDRKILIAILAAVALVVAGIVSYIVVRSVDDSQPDTVQNDITPENKIENIFAQLEEAINEGQWDKTSRLLKVLDEQLNAYEGVNKSDFQIREGNIEFKIKTTQQFNEARQETENKNYEKAISIYQSILKADNSNTEAQAELAELQKYLISKIVFELDERAQTILYVDNILQGSTPEFINLSPGEHQIRITREGYVDYEETVTLEANNSIKRTIELLESRNEADEPAKPANTKPTKDRGSEEFLKLDKPSDTPSTKPRSKDSSKPKGRKSKKDDLFL